MTSASFIADVVDTTCRLYKFVSSAKLRADCVAAAQHLPNKEASIDAMADVIREYAFSEFGKTLKL